SPSFSGDGSRITFESRRDGNAEIYVMNADGTGQTRLTNNSTNNAFSPATPFQATSGASINGGQNITYAGSPPPSALIWASGAPGANLAKGYDYELQLPSTIPIDQFSVYIVYTVIGN
ncbi:MAG: TolB family protein, partial [Candidatus Velthaea sp.]